MQDDNESGNSFFPLHRSYLNPLHTAFENNVGKKEIARNEQFLLFPQCFLLNTAFAPVWKDWRHIVLLLSVCPSVFLHKLNISITPKLIYKAHIWYEGTSHQYTSPGAKVKVICKGQGQISESCFSKDGCFGGD